MAQSLANFDAALKDDYGPGLRNAINNSNPVLTEATKNDEDIVGRRAVWSVHTGRSASTGSRGELSALPTADRQRFTQVSESLKFIYHTIQVSGQAKHLTQNDTGSFTRAMEAELSGAESDLKNDVSRQVFGQSLTDGTTLQTGVIATLSAGPASGAVLTFSNDPTSSIRLFFPGMTIQALNPAGGAARAGGPYTVQSTSLANKTVTLTGNVNAAVASGDYITRADSSGLGFTNEVNGLRHLISATDKFAGIDPATVPQWGAVAVGSATTGISEVVIDQAVEGVETDGDGGSPSLFLAEHAQRRKLASQLQAQKRYDGRETALTAGWVGLQVARGTLVADRYCPSTNIFALNTSELVRFVGLDWSWDDDDGKVLYKALDGTDSVQGRFKTYMQMVVTNRNSHSIVTLAEPTF